MASLTRGPRRGPFKCEDCGAEDSAEARTPKSKLCRGCWQRRKNEANKRWHHSHKDACNTKSKARYHANAEAICAATRDACREYARRRQAERPGEVRAARARWVARNPDKPRLYARRHLARNPEYFRHAAKARRARKAMVLNTLTNAEWVAILGVFNGACAYCLRTDRTLTQEHMVPISRGGPHSSDNVVPACVPCNSRKRDRSIFTMLR